MMNALINGLSSARSFPHRTSSISLIETHISWVILTGDFSYKIKKPVNFGFLNFSTLEKRRYYCNEEIRLNKRLAPEIYIAAVPIYGTPDRPRFDGRGEPIEYAVKMHEFDNALLLARLAKEKQVANLHIDQLAETVATFHSDAGVGDLDSDFGTPEIVHGAVMENFHQTLALIKVCLGKEKLGFLSDWSDQAFSRKKESLMLRKKDGYIRECHGDLHLGNIVVFNGVAMAFDCVEFNPALRWIDVVSDIAFLFMDLCVHNLRPLAYRFLNRYLEATGGYLGLELLEYYSVYRAIVRAKVALLASNPVDADQTASYNRYIDFAFQDISPTPSALIITYGFSGSGKSFISESLAEDLPAIRIRSDVERKRIEAETREINEHSERLYSKNVNDKTYERLAYLAERILASGFSIVIDATFLVGEYRNQFRKIAKRQKKRFLIVNIQAPLDVLRERIIKRAIENNDPSDADLSVLEKQIASFDPLTAKELEDTVAIESTPNVGIGYATRLIRSRFT